MDRNVHFVWMLEKRFITKNFFFLFNFEAKLLLDDRLMINRWSKWGKKDQHSLPTIHSYLPILDKIAEWGHVLLGIGITRNLCLSRPWQCYGQHSFDFFFCCFFFSFLFGYINFFFRVKLRLDFIWDNTYYCFIHRSINFILGDKWEQIRIIVSFYHKRLYDVQYVKLKILDYNNYTCVMKIYYYRPKITSTVCTIWWKIG